MDGQDIQYTRDAVKRFSLTKGLKVLLEIRGMYKTVAKTLTDADEVNYLEIIKITGIGPADDNYITELVNGERETGRKIGMGITTEVNNDVNPDV